MIKQKYEPTQEQKKFIKNNSNFLIVSAGPGSGKTETLTRYLIEKLPKIKKKIIVSSFTKNSTNEIKNRFHLINDKDSNEYITFQTFDSFLITKIWRFYFNRIVKYTIKKFKLDEKQIIKYSIEQNRIIYSKTTWKKFKKNYKKSEWINLKIKEFIKYFKDDILHIGFISEYILLLFIKSNDQIKKYISSNFERIVIDEAQDLSQLRYYILLELHIKTNIKITLVGDERQSIYGYLGAKKNVFKWINDEYGTKIQINKILLKKNFRYKNIDNINYIDIKNALKSENESNFKKSIKKAIELKIENIDVNSSEIINNLKENILFLAKTNKSVIQISDCLNKQKIENRAIFKLPNNLNISFEEQNFIENVFVYYMIINNEINKSDIKINIVDEICNFLWPFDPKSNNKFLKLFWNEKNDFDFKINQISEITGINNIKKVIDLFRKNKNYIFSLPQEKNQIMTFHGSKGLEAENIFINKKDVDNYFSNIFGAPSFEEMFVAFSRSKNKIFILKLNII